MSGVVFGPDGLRLGVVSGSRSAVAAAARELGGVQVYVSDGDARECWTTSDVGGAWRRAWRREVAT